MDFPGEKSQRHGNVVGRPFGAQVGQHRVVHRTGRIGQAAPRFGVHGPDRVNRALEVILRGEPAMVRRVHLNLVAVLVPEIGAAGDVGVQRAHEKADAVYRDAALAQRAAQIAERFLRRAAGRPGTEQPVEQGRTSIASSATGSIQWLRA